ncbi:L,D-transpeptidase [Patescibacteria group bacterium]|nr:L,D-transpeptidase [Patescibacteria group bacterium]
MKSLFRYLDITTLGLAALASLFVYQVYAAEFNEISELPYHYRVVNQSPNPSYELGSTGSLRLTIQNTGRANWPINQVYLSSVLFNGIKNTESQFITSNWVDNYRIAPMASSPSIIRPREKVNFIIPLKSIKRPGVFQESFKPALEHLGFMDGDRIDWLVGTGGSAIQYQNAAGEDKEIKIWLDDQRLWAIENGVVIMSAPVSTGMGGVYATPIGTYTTYNHIDRAYSSAYKLYMDNWMALKSTKYGLKGYGIHALPHVNVNPNNPKFKGKDGQLVGGRLYVDGRWYEGYSHIGKKMSHGCVRLGLSTSKTLFDWTEDGTKVEVI